MKTYPYTTPEGIIELVSKDEHEDVVSELLARLEERTQSHLAASARDVQTIQRQSFLLDRLATNLRIIVQLSDRDVMFWDHAKLALAAYKSAKSGNLPDPLAEAVKRMEGVSLCELEDTYFDSASMGCEGVQLPDDHDHALSCVRARLISAAKGEQP